MKRPGASDPKARGCHSEVQGRPGYYAGLDLLFGVDFAVRQSRRHLWWGAVGILDGGRSARGLSNIGLTIGAANRRPRRPFMGFRLLNPSAAVIRDFQVIGDAQAF